MRNSEKITQTFNGAVEWLTAGNYFKLMSTVNPVTVELFNRGERVHRALNVEGGHYQRVEFDRVQITTGANEAVSWLYAPHEGGSDRFTGAFSVSGPLLGDNADGVAAAGASILVGTVARLMSWNGATWDRVASVTIAGVKALIAAPYGTLGQLVQVVVNGINSLAVRVVTAKEDNVTLAGQAFAGAGNCAAVAAKYSTVQLMNPLASGKRVYIDRVILGARGVAMSVSAGVYATALATTSAAGINKYTGGGASSALVKTEALAATLGAAAINYHDIPASVSTEVVFDPPISIGGGEGFALQAQTVNNVLDGAFQYREVPA